jgi:hypothetical protein
MAGNIDNNQNDMCCLYVCLRVAGMLMSGSNGIESGLIRAIKGHFEEKPQTGVGRVQRDTRDAEFNQL